MFVNVFISCIRSHRQSVGICVQKSKVQALSLLMFGNVFISCVLYPLTYAEYVNVWKCIHILYPVSAHRQSVGICVQKSKVQALWRV